MLRADDYAAGELAHKPGSQIKTTECGSKRALPTVALRGPTLSCESTRAHLVVQAPSLWHEMLQRSDDKDDSSETCEDGGGLELPMQDDGLFAATDEKTVNYLVDLSCKTSRRRLHHGCLLLDLG